MRVALQQNTEVVDSSLYLDKYCYLAAHLVVLEGRVLLYSHLELMDIVLEVDIRWLDSFLEDSLRWDMFQVVGEVSLLADL